MSLKKQYLKSKSICKVTFRLRASEAGAATMVRLVGDFNDWDITAAPMKQLKSGDFTQTIALPSDRQYEFRYLLNDTLWENDWEADAYAPSPLSVDDNSVIHV